MKGNADGEGDEQFRNTRSILPSNLCGGGGSGFEGGTAWEIAKSPAVIALLAALFVTRS